MKFNNRGGDFVGKKIKIISTIFVVFICVTLAIISGIKFIEKPQIKVDTISENNTENEVIVEKLIKENKTEEEKIEIIQEKEEKLIWKIEIPKINLEAEIAEGTDVDVLNCYVGHFEDTSLKERKHRTSST